MLGAASMSAVSALQLGLVKHLPDPPLAGFDSDKVNLSATAMALPIPDGVLSLGSFLLNVPLIFWGGRDRAEKRPWIPLLFAGKLALESVVSAVYFSQMPLKEHAWCGYCIIGAAATWTLTALVLPEAVRAARTLLHRRSASRRSVSHASA